MHYIKRRRVYVTLHTHYDDVRHVNTLRRAATHLLVVTWWDQRLSDITPGVSHSLVCRTSQTGGETACVMLPVNKMIPCKHVSPADGFSNISRVQGKFDDARLASQSPQSRVHVTGVRITRRPPAHHPYSNIYHFTRWSDLQQLFTAHLMYATTYFQPLHCYICLLTSSEQSHCSRKTNQAGTMIDRAPKDSSLTIVDQPTCITNMIPMIVKIIGIYFPCDHLSSICTSDRELLLLRKLSTFHTHGFLPKEPSQTFVQK